MASPVGCFFLDVQVWSAYREPSFGHGMLVLNSAQTAQWRWNRNQDAGDAKLADAVRLPRDIATLPLPSLEP